MDSIGLSIHWRALVLLVVRVSIRAFLQSLRIISPVHDITIRLSSFVTLSEQLLGVLSIVNPAFGRDEAGYYLVISVNRYRSFQEMFSDFARSCGVIMARISAGKSGWIYCCDRDRILVRVEQVQRFFECEPEIEGFDPTEKFLKCCEMGYGWQLEDLLDLLHVPDIFNDVSVMLVTVVFEKNEDEKLMLSIDLLRILLRILAGIRQNPCWLHYR